jgi:hypothetical protein
MKITLGKDGLKKTWQWEFAETTKCCRCGGNAMHAFTAHEGLDAEDRKGKFVYNLKRNLGKGNLWPHDCIAMAIYLCRNCLHATAIYNQG